MPAVTTDDFVNFATEKPEKKSRVINLSQYGPTYFGPEHAQVSLYILGDSIYNTMKAELDFVLEVVLELVHRGGS